LHTDVTSKLAAEIATLSGVAVLRQIRATDPGLRVIVMTGLGTLGEIAEARVSEYRDHREA